MCPRNDGAGSAVSTRNPAGASDAGTAHHKAKVMNLESLSKSGLDPVFIEAQRQRLEALLDQLIGSGDYAGRDEQIAQYESVDEVRDAGDNAQSMAINENDEATVQYTIRRLADVRRALEKIEQGTYGLSDVSGEPIGKARLLAIPEAVTAIAEEQVLSK